MVMECRPFEVCGIPEITVNAFYEWTMDINMNVTDIGWRCVRTSLHTYMLCMCFNCCVGHYTHVRMYIIIV